MTAIAETPAIPVPVAAHACPFGTPVRDLCPDCAADVAAYARLKPCCPHCGNPARFRGDLCDDCAEEAADAAYDRGIQQTQIIVRGAILR